MKRMSRQVWFRVVGMAMSLVFAFAASGCGAMLKGTSQLISINSDPTRAEATVTSNKGDTTVVLTPGNVKLKKNRQYTIHVEKEGYQPQELSIRRKADAGTVAMDVIWAILLAPYLFWVPLVVDGPTGAWYKFEPTAFSVLLEPTGETPEAPAAEAAPPAEKPGNTVESPQPDSM